MPTSTAAGSTLAISATAPATQDVAGYTAVGIVYTEIGGIDKLGSFGATFSKVDFRPLKGPVQKHKGSVDFGALQPSMAFDDADAGQNLLRTAADDATSKPYTFLVTFPTGAKRYFQARVFGAPETADGPDTILMSTVTIELIVKPVKVAAA